MMTIMKTEDMGGSLHASLVFEVVSHAEPNSQILWELSVIVHA